MTGEHGAIGRHYIDRMTYEDFRTLGGGDMRGIHRSRGRHRRAGRRFGLVVLVVSLALVISQSVGMIAANAFGPKTLGAWGSQSTSINSSGDSSDESLGGGGGDTRSNDRSTGGSPQTAHPTGTEESQDITQQQDSAGLPTTTLHVQPTLIA